MVLLVRAARCFGWIVFAGSVGAVLVALTVQLLQGPVAEQTWWPGPRLWRYFFTSLGIAAGACFFAMLISLPASLALITARRGVARSIISALAILPIITMPSSHSYAWFLMSTSKVAIVSGFMKIVHWNAPGMQPVDAAWVLAAWLWPIPCLVIAASFRRTGAGTFQLASMDAPPRRAFGSALSVMRGPVIAAFAGVFCLALIDSTIPPLVGANQVWSAELMAQASAAIKYDRPAAFLFFQAWPMLAVIAVLGLIALPGLRQMARWAEPPDEDLGVVRAAAWWPSVVLVGLISFLPFVVFCVELSTGRTTACVAVATAARTLWKSGVASMIVALVSALGAVCLAVALIDVETRRGALTVLRRIAFALLLVAAVLPPELIGISLVSVYAKIAGPSDWWSLYDRSPWPWAMGMVVRFGFLTACVGRFLVRHPAGELAASATLDGASPIERLVHARLPLIRGPLITAGIMVACLTMSEVAISLLVQPPRFIGGSFAVAVDSQMHYGRQNETVAGALMLAIPSMLAAGCAAAVTGRRAGK